MKKEETERNEELREISIQFKRASATLLRNDLKSYRQYIVMVVAALVKQLIGALTMSIQFDFQNNRALDDRKHSIASCPITLITRQSSTLLRDS